MEYDVVIVGAGPSGLSTAIKLKQIRSKFKCLYFRKRIRSWRSYIKWKCF